MRMVYDRRVVDKFREKAITDKSQLVIGQRYFTNALSQKSFVLKSLGSDFDFPEPYANLPNNTHEIRWIFPEEGSEMSLRDRNIGASYNPWLIFENEEDMKAYESELEITWVRDKWDEYDDSYYYDRYED